MQCLLHKCVSPARSDRQSEAISEQRQAAAGVNDAV